MRGSLKCSFKTVSGFCPLPFKHKVPKLTQKRLTRVISFTTENPKCSSLLVPVSTQAHHLLFATNCPTWAAQAPAYMQVGPVQQQEAWTEFTTILQDLKRLSNLYLFNRPKARKGESSQVQHLASLQRGQCTAYLRPCLGESSVKPGTLAFLQ